MDLSDAEADADAASEAELLDVARRARKHAYAPYSGFRVGAAVRTAAGAVYPGCNVENASYGLTICAERSAVFAAVTAEGAGCRVDAVAIVAEGADATPCGACRQVLAEFGPDAEVSIHSDTGEMRTTIAELLPHHFRLRDEP